MASISTVDIHICEYIYLKTHYSRYTKCVKRSHKKTSHYFRQNREYRRLDHDIGAWIIWA
jgi:hypothetical protein